MKKLVCLVLALLMLGSTAMAMTEINPKEERRIVLQEVTENEVIEGVSPTTGLTLDTLYVPEGFEGLAATGRYMPMMVSIGNDEGGVGNRAPWGAGYVDVVYEMPLHRNGNTRLVFIYSDLIPNSVGYIRSARVGHVWLWSEWRCGFLFYGQQEYEGSNVVEEFKKQGVNIVHDPMLFSGIVSEGYPWKKYYTARQGLKTPYHVDANVAEMYKLLPEDAVAPNHAFKFTDETPEGENATEIRIKWGSGGIKYGSNLIYDVDLNAYKRYMRYSGNKLHLWQDKDTEEAIVFSNVIVQFTNVWYNKRNDAPVVEQLGEGNAEIFMCGKRIKGYWKRDALEDRTVFYGPDGNEIELQRGKTLIVLFPNDDLDDREVSYQ